jgi:hypothetical protein
MTILLTIPESHSCILSHTSIRKTSTGGLSGPSLSENALYGQVQRAAKNEREAYQSWSPRSSLQLLLNLCGLYSTALVINQRVGVENRSSMGSCIDSDSPYDTPLRRRSPEEIESRFFALVFEASASSIGPDAAYHRTAKNSGLVTAHEELAECKLAVQDNPQNM